MTAFALAPELADALRSAGFAPSPDPLVRCWSKVIGPAHVRLEASATRSERDDPATGRPLILALILSRSIRGGALLAGKFVAIPPPAVRPGRRFFEAFAAAVDDPRTFRPVAAGSLRRDLARVPVVRL